MRIIYYIILTTTLFLLCSCSTKDSGASDRLVMARAAMNTEDFDQAKAHIDSIKILYPKAYPEQRLGIALLDSIRRAENEFIIARNQSEILSLTLKLDSMKVGFIYNIDKEYQDEGVYIPKELWNNGILSTTTLRPGVKESGELFIESIYVGSQLHDHLQVSLSDGSISETQIIKDSGFNFHFTNLGKQFEVIRFDNDGLNDVANFINEHALKTINVSLLGGNKYIYQLPLSVKRGVRKCSDLSKVILQINNLKDEIEKANFRNFKLYEKKNIS